MGQSQVKTSCSPTLYGVSDSLVPEGAVYLGKVTQVEAPSVRRESSVPVVELI